MNWRRMLFEIVEPDKGSSVASRIFDWLITSLILLSVVIVFAGTFDLPQRTLNALSAVECIASIVFTVKYGIRILTADFLYPERGAIRSRLRTDGDSPRQALRRLSKPAPDSTLEVAGLTARGGRSGR